MPALIARRPVTRPAWVPALPVAWTMWSIATPHLVRLVDEFERAVGVAERAGRVGAAAGDRVDAAPLRPEPVGDRLHDRVHVAAARVPLGGGAVQVVEEDVAVPVVVRVVRAGPVLQQDMARHPEAGGEGGGLAGVVRLGGTLRHHQVRTLCLGLGHQELELAGLVAAGRQPGAVVALDPDLRSAEFAPTGVAGTRAVWGDGPGARAGSGRGAWEVRPG